jgi:cardiolipin synthase
MLTAIVILIAELLGVVSAIHAVMNSRTSQGAIAWVVSLITFPFIAVPAYWVLGRSKFQGYLTARRKADDRSDRLEIETIESTQQFRVPEAERHEATRAGEALAGMPALRGNRTELLIDGDATFTSILAGIDRAEVYVLFQFFIVKDDEIGRKIKQHLVMKAEEGVAVYFLYDEVGSHALPESYKQELRNAGVRVSDFNARKGRGNRSQINFRNHRKVVVVDGKEAWIGGHNVGDEYLGKSKKFGHWRDTHVRIEGPAVLKVQHSFCEDWAWATDEVPALDWNAHSAPDGSDEAVLIIPTGPADSLETASLMFVHAINTAQLRIWIASPYFVPDEAVMVALQLAGLRGVDVRILIPDNPDHLLVYLAAFSYFNEAGQTGTKFYRYTDGFLHQKAMLVDDFVAAIGTANFDNRSFRLNFEITAAVADAGFSSQVERMFLADFERSYLMEKDEYDRRPWWFRFAVQVARLMSPIL